MGLKMCEFVQIMETEVPYFAVFSGVLRRGGVSLNQVVVGSSPTGGTQ